MKYRILYSPTSLVRATHRVGFKQKFCSKKAAEKFFLKFKKQNLDPDCKWNFEIWELHARRI
jgi:hypothetical protein